jgi:prepilin-type N-terminal cleavage/methylation domain-containing protein
MNLRNNSLRGVTMVRAGPALCPWGAPRRGFTLLEFVVALLLFGMAMSGLFPLVVMYSRALEVLEQRPSQLSGHRSAGVDDNAYRLANPAEWYQVGAAPYTRTDSQPNAGDWVHKWYLVPCSDSASRGSNVWARKLGACASIRYRAPTGTIEEPVDVPTTAEITVWDAGVAGHYSQSLDPSWTDYAPTPGAYGDNQRRPDPGKVGTATWTFNDVAAGWYRVEATGLVAGATTLPAGTYRLSNGTTTAEDVTPAKALAFGTSAVWQPLTTKYISAGDVTVQLTTDTSGTAIADAVRLVRCSVQIKSLTWSTSDTATASVEIKPAVRSP